MLDVIVIGGGVSGLTAAHELVQGGLDVAVLERQVVAGGNAISERFDGFLMEHGPTTFNASMPDAVGQIEALGLLEKAADLGVGVKKRYLCNGDHLSGISVNPMGFFKSNYLSLPGRLRMLTEIAVPRKKDGAEETVFDFTRRRFGREFAEKVMDPMAAGMFMGEARALSVQGIFPRLAELEQRFGSITRGVLNAKRGSAPGRHLYSWRQGVGAIPQSLARQLGKCVHLGVSVLKLHKTANGFEVKTSAGTQRARRVILAVQPNVAASLLEGLAPDAATALAEIGTPPVNVVFLGYRREQIGHPLDGLGFLSTSASGKIISGAQFASTMYEGRAPQGYVAISAYAGGVRNPELAQLPDAELTALVHGELADLLGIKGAPAVSRTRRWALGLPQYTLGHQRRVSVLLDIPSRVEGLYVTGNYLHGVSLANCMTSARSVAQQVLEAMGPVLANAEFPERFGPVSAD